MTGRITDAQALTLLSEGPFLLYDGECGVCNASVQWVLSHERTPGELRFAALQSQAGFVLRALADVDESVDSLLWVSVKEGQVKAQLYSSSVYAVLRHVGGFYTILALLLWLIPKPIRDLGYRLFAKIRKSVIAEQCLIPTPEQRKRFFEKLPERA